MIPTSLAAVCERLASIFHRAQPHLHQLLIASRAWLQSGRRQLRAAWQAAERFCRTTGERTHDSDSE